MLHWLISTLTIVHQRTRFYLESPPVSTEQLYSNLFVPNPATSEEKVLTGIDLYIQNTFS